MLYSRERLDIEDLAGAWKASGDWEQACQEREQQAALSGGSANAWTCQLARTSNRSAQLTEARILYTTAARCFSRYRVEVHHLQHVLDPDSWWYRRQGLGVGPTSTSLVSRNGGIPSFGHPSPSRSHPTPLPPVAPFLPATLLSDYTFAP